jgi:Leucine-rich repeat (LRR) protein
MSEPTEGLASSGPAQDAIPDPVDERAPFEPDGNVATIIFSRIADVQTRAALTMASRSWRDASRLLASLPKHNNGRLNLDGLSETQIDHLVDVYGLTSLDEERMLAVAGVDKEDFCEWAATRTGCLKLVAWALERDFPWAGYPHGVMSREELRRVTRGELTRESQELNLDVLALRAWRASELQEDVWREDESSHTWPGVKWVNCRLETIKLHGVSTVPACIGQFSLLRDLIIPFNSITSLPPAIGKLTNLKRMSLYKHIDSEYALESLPAEIGRLTSLTVLDLGENKLTSLPAEIGQLTSLTELILTGNQLTSLPATIGQLTSLKKLYLAGNQLTSVPAEVRQFTQLQELILLGNQLTTLPEWIIELTSLNMLLYDGIQRTSLPAAVIDALTAMGYNLDI